MEPTILGGNRVEVRGGTLTVDGAHGASLHIGLEPRTIGRGDGCDIVLDDKQVSKVHAELLATERGVRVRDLGSRNGIFLGTTRIVEAFLTEATTLRCGKSTLSLTPTAPEKVRLADVEEFGALVGTTPSMRLLFARLRKMAPTNLSVLILGETGTGKEVVAQSIHRASKRSSKPFVVVDCSAIPTGLAESTLFGHEKGSFTGATSRHASPFSEADGGTVFLDEIGELPIEVQPKLLRVLAEQRVKSVGSNNYTSVDVRVLAATRRDLAHEINAGGFRSDLYFRLRQEKVELPALRERRDDLRALVHRIMDERGEGAAFRRVPKECFERLARHDWPGNVRELRDVVARGLAYDEKSGPLELSIIDEEHTAAISKQAERGTLRDAYARLEADYYATIHAEMDGNISDMARAADVDRKTVREALRRYHIGNVAKRRR